MSSEILLSHWLILWHIFSIRKVLVSHLILPVLLSLLVRSNSFICIDFLKVDKRSFVSSFVGVRVMSKLKVSFSQFILNILGQSWLLHSTFIGLTESWLINRIFEKLISLSNFKMTLLYLVSYLVVFILLFVNYIKASVVVVRERLGREF